MDTKLEIDIIKELKPIKYEIELKKEKSPFAIGNIKPLRIAKEFNKDYTISRYGKDYNLYQMIQDAREDTEIYPTLYKYGSIKRMEVDYNDIYDDLSAIGDLRNIQDLKIAADKAWAKVPTEVKNQFNNDKYLFAEKGKKWAEDILKTQKEKANIEAGKIDPVTKQPIKQEEINNE